MVSTATTTSARSAVLALSRDDQHRRFLDASARLLPLVGEDGELVLAIMRSLVALGLGGPARELSRLPWLARLVDVGELQRSLAGVPIGRVRTDDALPTLDANLSARAELADRRDEFVAALDRADLFLTNDGQYLLAERLEDGTRAWRTGFTSEREVDALELPLRPDGPVPAVVGLGLNRLAERVLEATAPNRFGATVPLYLVDDQILRTATWLATADRRPVLEEERVLVFVGTDAVERVEERLRAEEDLPAPEMYLKAADDTDLGDRLNAAIQRAAVSHVEPFRVLLRDIGRRADARGHEDWAERLRPGATVIGFTSRFTTMVQHTLRDLSRAFEDRGYRFITRIERSPFTRNTLYTNARRIHEHDPALIVLVNHFRREQPESLVGVPVLSWVQDPADTVFSAETGASLGSRDFVCGYYLRECVTDFGFPRQRFLPWPIPVSTHVFHDGPLSPDEAEQFTCDAMYVGHRPQSPAALRSQFDATASPVLQPVLDRLESEAASALRDGTFLAPRAPRTVQRVGASFGFEFDAEGARSLGFFLTRVYDSMFREQTLRWVADWARRTGRRFNLYGDGWSDDPELGPFARGPLAHGPELRRAYRGARLVIQTMPTGFQHQRTFEAYSSGAFVLARRSLADLAGQTLDVFNRNARLGNVRFGTRARYRGFEAITFDDAASFAERAEHFLAADAERESIRERFAGIVARECTYDGLVPGLIDWIRTGLRESAAEPAP